MAHKGLKHVYTILRSSDTATLGSALVAGYGAGLYNDIATTADNFIEVRETIAHDINIFHKYKGYVDTYRKIFIALNDIYSNLEKLER